jgi:hypothetical protein
MNCLVSPFKLFQEDLNSFIIDTNVELGGELREYFNNFENNYLWKISTHRQTVTQALRFTESIHLRHLKDLPPESNTLQANQHMIVAQSKIAEFPIFKKAIIWFESALKSKGAKNVEFGRIFVSKLAANSIVDSHSDSGKYFSYYDRFHFTITAAEENIFSIRDENCILNIDSLYWVNNHVPHWLENRSNKDRINFIVDARLT